MFDTQMTPERFAALPLREQFIAVARARVAAGLSPYETYGEKGREVRESAATTEGDVRESASLNDMPNILGNNIYRELDNWFKQYSGDWQKYCKQVSLVDYRPKVVAFVSEMEDALEIRQERDFQDSALLDRGYTIQLKNWGRQVTLPFIVIENDDKGFVKQIPEKMQRAADRTMQKLIVRTWLETNGVNSSTPAYDGVALYSTSRTGYGVTGSVGNLFSGATAVLSMANLMAGVQYLQQATGDPDLNPSQAPLNIPAKYLLVPNGLEMQAANLLNSVSLLGAATVVNNSGSGAPNGTFPGVATTIPQVTGIGDRNPLQMAGFHTPLTLVVDRYLTNMTNWYLMPSSDEGPITVGTRQGRGLRPKLWVNVPQRQAIMGGSADDYLLSVSDIVYGFSFDLLPEALGSFHSNVDDKARELGEPCDMVLAA